MIRNAATRDRFCDVCHEPATRYVNVDGYNLPLCDRCPSPEDIRDRAAALRDTWPRWRWQQARRDERHGAPVDFREVVHLGE